MPKIFSQNGKVLTQNNKIFTTPWSPKDVNNMLFWGDANSRNIIKDSNGINTWKDSSGNMIDATQTNNSKKPIYLENIINGYPVLYFQNKSIIIPSLHLNEFTVVSVVKSFNSNFLYEFGETENTGGFFMNGGNNSIAVSSNGLSNASIKNNGTNWLPGSWKIIIHRYYNSHITHNMYVNGVYFNNTTYISYNNNPGVLNKTSNLTLGSKTNDTYRTNSYFAEYMLYNRCLSINETLSISNYLNKKYMIY